MSDGAMRDILSRLETQEAELASARARLEAQEAQLAALHARRRPTRARRWLTGPRTRGRTAALAIVSLLVALVPLGLLAANPFTDLVPGSVHNPDIDTIYNLGVTTGCVPDMEYCPTADVTRQEMASFLARTAKLSRIATASFSTATADANLGAGAARDYMSVYLTVPGKEAMYVRVSFTGYAFARSTVDGCPCLLRGSLRADDGTAEIVTRTVIGTNPLDQVGGGDVAVAERRDFSGSAVFFVEPGEHSFTMTLTREFGTSPTVGFAFGNMQAELVPFSASGMLGAMPAYAVLNGANEVVPTVGDPDGVGAAAVTLNPETGEVCFALTVTNIAAATLAHIHRGAAGVNGPVVVDFVAPADGTSSGCTTVDAALAAEIAGNLAGFYVNVHNGDHPGGAVRGQLTP